MKINLSAKQEAWLLRHFRHTKNDEITRRLGVSHTWLHRYAREHGLVKTARFQKKCQAAAAAAAKESHLRNGTYPPKGFIIPGSEAYRFKPGRKESPAAKRRRVLKATATRNRTIKEDQARVRWGLPQLTKMRLIRQPKKATEQRYYLRKRGYHVERGSLVMYYDENTLRCPKIEARQRGDRNYIGFTFKPIEL